MILAIICAETLTLGSHGEITADEKVFFNFEESGFLNCSFVFSHALIDPQFSSFLIVDGGVGSDFRAPL